MDAMRAHSSPDLRAFNILIKGYSRAGDVAALQRTLQSIRSQVVASLRAHEWQGEESVRLEKD